MGPGIYSSNDGTAWEQVIDEETGPDLRDVQPMGEGAALVVGANGLILKTTDSGATWESRSGGVTAILTAVHAIDAERVLVAGEGGVVLVSTDAGNSWTQRSIPTEGDIHGIAEAGDGIYMVTSKGELLTSSDDGENWEAEQCSDGALFCVEVTEEGVLLLGGAGEFGEAGVLYRRLT